VKKPKFPLEVKAGAVRVKIYNVSTPARERYTLAYHDGPERKLKQFSDFATARREAKTVAETLNAGRGAALELSGADRDTYLAALRALKPLDMPLNVAVAEYVKAKQFNVPLVEAAKSYAESHDAKLPDKTIEEVYQEMLAAMAYLHLQHLRALMDTDLSSRLQKALARARELQKQFGPELTPRKMMQYNKYLTSTSEIPALLDMLAEEDRAATEPLPA
jgi:hypothetical protein